MGSTEQPASLDFGRSLKRYRIAAGLTQEALAERAGVSVRAIMYLERGAHSPYPATLLRLAQALGLAPGEHAALLAAADVSASHPEASHAAAAPRNPYKGLRAFGSEDAGDFFGRERLIDSLLATMRAAAGEAPRFLAVVGPSGSGKSSLVRAGLLPRLMAGAVLDSQRWQYLDPLLPGAHPLEALIMSLGAALPDTSLRAIREDLESSPRGLHLLAGRLARGAETRVVLVVDQCEELFTLVADEEERQTFIDLLTTAANEPRGPLLVILTLRADFYDRPMGYPALGKLMEVGSRSVLPMEPDELRAAIECPAALPDVRLRFEQDLVARLLAEVRGQAGALPLLQFTLDQLFERRAGDCLTLAAYEELGGVRGALAWHAEATYTLLSSEEERTLARALFLRLIDPGLTEQDTTRRRAAISELALPDPGHTAAMRSVVDAFIAARLLTSGEVGGITSIEVSHEALIREWPRLAGWLREARDDVRLQQAISADAAEWERRGHPLDRLYRGAVLDEGLDWASRNIPSATEHAFLAAGLAERERQEAAARQQQARELALARQAALANRQAAARLRALAAVLAAFLVVSVGLSALAINRARTADDAARQAARARQVALARQLAAQAINHLGDQYDLALLLAVEANRVYSTAETRYSLLQALEYNTPLLSFLHGHQGPVMAVTFSPDGKTLATGGVDGTVRLWDVGAHRLVAPPLLTGGATITSVAFSPDGALLAAGDAAGTLLLWDLPHRRLLGRIASGHTLGVENVAISHDGTLLGAAFQDGQVRLWSVPDLRPYGRVLPLRGRFVTCVAFSPAGSVLAAGDGDGTVQYWDVAHDRAIGDPLTVGQTSITSLAFSPEGATLAVGGADGTIAMWDAVNGGLLFQPLTGHTGSVTSLAFSPDGKKLASGSTDYSIRLWDTSTGQPVGQPLTGNDGSVNSVAFSPDGTVLASGGNDGAVRLWDMTGGRPLTGHTDSVPSVAFSPDGRMLASSSNDRTIRLWDTTSRHQIGPPLTGHTGGVNTLAFSPDGKLLASGAADRTIRLWDMASRRQLGLPLTGPTDGVTSLAFSPDGRTLAAGSSLYDGGVRLWAIPSRKLLVAIRAPATGIGVNSVAFSPDGRLVAASYTDETIRIWDVASGRLNGRPLTSPIGGITGLAFSPDGKILAAAGTDRTIRLWNAVSRTLLGPPLIGHRDRVVSIAFSPDGSTLASGSWDDTIRLWDVASGQPIGPALAGHSDRVNSVAFSPDGSTLASGSADTTIRLWRVGVPLWTQDACRIANRNLTPQEWRAYLGNEGYLKTCSSL